MTRKAAASSPAWDDEDLPGWTDDQLDRAELAVGGTVGRPGNGTPTRVGRHPPWPQQYLNIEMRLEQDMAANPTTASCSANCIITLHTGVSDDLVPVQDQPIEEIIFERIDL